MQRRRILLSTLAAGTLLAGCESLQRTDSFIGQMTPYRIDIVQGNAVTREQAALLKPGLSRLQVRDILGTPLIADPFHADRWDYVFTLRRAKTDAQRRSVVVWFEGDVRQVDRGHRIAHRARVRGLDQPFQGPDRSPSWN